jgi:hypothetical protein
LSTQRRKESRSDLHPHGEDKEDEPEFFDKMQNMRIDLKPEIAKSKPGEEHSANA